MAFYFLKCIEIANFATQTQDNVNPITLRKEQDVNTDRQRGRCGQHVQRPQGDYPPSDRDEAARREDSELQAKP